MHLLTRLAFDRMQAGILLFLGEYLVDADPTAAGRREALAAATSLCPVSINNGSQLTNDLQAAVSGQVLTCNNSRSAFLDAIALYKPSGYPKDTELVPAFVVEPVDVVEAIGFAAKHNLELAVKGGGYAMRNEWKTDKGLTIALNTHMHGVKVDAARQEVVVQGGAVYADILAATRPYGLAVPWGDAEQTGMGLALGGGIGYLMRPYGLTTDNIINATVVLANGSEVTASADKNADLLAAMRGGGTVFGVVTEVALKAYDVSGYRGGSIIFTDDADCTVHRAAHEWAAEAVAKEPSLGVEIFQTAPTGESIVQVQVGMPASISEQDRKAIIAPLRNLSAVVQKDTLDTLSYAAFEHSLTEVIDKTTPYTAAYIVSAVLSFQQAEDGLLDLMPKLMHGLPESVTYTYLADYMGNTVSSNAVKNTASFTPFGGDIDFHFFISYNWPAGVDDAANSAFAQEQIKLITPHVASTQPYYNLATVVNNATLEYQVGGASNLAELRRLKRQLDPTNLFQRHGHVGL